LLLSQRGIWALAIVLQLLLFFCLFFFLVQQIFYFHQQIWMFWFFFSVISTNIAKKICWKCLPIFFNHKIGKKNSCFAMCFFSWAPNKQCPPLMPHHPKTHTHTHTHNCDKPLQQASLSMVDRWTCAHNSIKCKVLHLICGIATWIYPMLPKNTTRFGSQI
jgi:hypothetical protein